MWTFDKLEALPMRREMPNTRQSPQVVELPVSVIHLEYYIQTINIVGQPQTVNKNLDKSNLHERLFTANFFRDTYFPGFLE